MRLLEEVVKESTESLWKKIGEKALTTAVTTLVGEVVKAAVDLKKRSKLRKDKAEFDDERKMKSSKSSKSSKKQDRDDAPKDQDSGDADDVDDEEEAAAERGGPEHADDDDRESQVLSFEQYLTSRR